MSQTRVISAPPAFFKLLPRFNLIDVRLLRSLVEIVPDPGDESPGRYEFTEGADEPSISDGRCLVPVEFVAKGLRPRKDHPMGGVAAYVEATFAVVYSTSAGLSPSEISSVVRISAVYHSWPYWRECLSSSLTRVGMPFYTLPMLSITASKEAADSAQLELLEEPSP